jgi:SanA protein
VAAVAAAAMHHAVAASAKDRIATFASAPSARVAIVFGAHMFRDGTPGYAARLRLQAAQELYRRGKVSKILVSGNNQVRCNRESDAMREWLIQNGIPPGDVSCDHAGFRTLDTCARAAKVWNLKEAILVTQRYHLPRALYLAQAFGLEATGISADGEGGSECRRDAAREVAARIVAWLDVNVLHRGPRYLGKPETI